MERRGREGEGVCVKGNYCPPGGDDVISKQNEEEGWERERVKGEEIREGTILTYGGEGHA